MSVANHAELVHTIVPATVYTAHPTSVMEQINKQKRAMLKFVHFLMNGPSGHHAVLHA